MLEPKPNRITECDSRREDIPKKPNTEVLRRSSESLASSRAVEGEEVEPHPFPAPLTPPRNLRPLRPPARAEPLRAKISDNLVTRVVETTRDDLDEDLRC